MKTTYRVQPHRHLTVPKLEHPLVFHEHPHRHEDVPEHDHPHVHDLIPHEHPLAEHEHPLPEHDHPLPSHSHALEPHEHEHDASVHLHPVIPEGPPPRRELRRLPHALWYNPRRRRYEYWNGRDVVPLEAVTVIQRIGGGGGSGGTPSDSVVAETSFGQASSPGMATTYARGDHTHGTPPNPVPAHEAAADPHTQYQKESEKGQPNGYAGLDAAGVIPDGQAGGGTPGEQANTTPSSFTKWANQSGTARKVLVWDSANNRPKWEYIQAFDVLTPPQILTFTVIPSAGPSASHTGTQSGLALVDGGGNTDTPDFSMSYEGTPSAASIDIYAHNYGGGRSPEVNAGDYPTTVASPYTSHTGPAINAGQAIGEYVTFRLTATVDGVEKTKDVTLTYYNERLWGVSTNAAIDTDAEIDTFHDSQNKEISNTRVKTFTVTAGAGEYIYYIIPSRFGTPTFKVGGFEGGFSLIATVSHSNCRGYTENYDVWRSDNPNLGTVTVEVT